MTEKATIVTISYSFDDEVIAIPFTNEADAVKFIQEDFQKEKEIDMENGWIIDEKLTYCHDGLAVLGTIYPKSGMLITKWTIATIREVNKKRN